MLRMIEAYGGSRLDKILYAQFEGEKKIVDLTSFVMLSEFAFAVRVFERYGVGEPLGEILEELGKNLKDQNAKQTGSKLKDFGRYFFLGVRVPLGKIACEVVERAKGVRRLIKNKLEIQPLKQKLEEPTNLASRLAFPNKEELTLDDEEIRKELDFVEELIKRSMHEKALQVMREVMVNKVILETYYKEPYSYHKVNRPDYWLVYTDFHEGKRIQTMRIKAEDFLTGKLDARNAPEQLRKLYEKLEESRNFFAHAGFKNEDLGKLKNLETKLKNYTDS